MAAMKDAQAAPAVRRPLLIPLDDREALLALRDFERPASRAGGAGAPTQGRAADVLVPKDA